MSCQEKKCKYTTKYGKGRSKKVECIFTLQQAKSFLAAYDLTTCEVGTEERDPGKYRQEIADFVKSIRRD